MFIRPYAPSDLDTLITLFRVSVRQGAVGEYRPEQLLAWAPDEIDREIWAQKRASASTWVAEREGRIVGFSDIEPDGHIDMLYVHPVFHRRGIATALLGHVEHEAKERDIPLLHAAASLAARPVFEKAGFRVVREQTVSCNGQDFINFVMEKKV